MIRAVAVLGGGTAGLLAALTIRRTFPRVRVQVVHSSEIGTIGVGEGTTPIFPRHLLDTLKLDARRMHAQANPTWKLGIRFLWGPRPEFYYSFDRQFEGRWSDLPRPHGFYNTDEYVPADLPSALMAAGKCAPRRLDGFPDFLAATALHVENAHLIEWLNDECRAAGIEFVEGKLTDVQQTSEGDLTQLLLQDARAVSADFFVDATGFRRELIGHVFNEPYESWSAHLFCDRAVIGGWTRGDEPILPYTTAETMCAGWSWQIEHEHFINRGYVYCSQFLSDDEARAELAKKNPRMDPAKTRVVSFTSGYLRDTWIRNCVAIGNSAGFVEPLEATALSVMVLSVRAIAEALRDADLAPTEGHRRAYNRYAATAWEETRDFLALHYRFNTRLNTPFWQHAREHTPLGTVAALVDFYQEAGPALFGRYLLEHADNLYAFEGHLALLVGQAVPYRAKYTPSDEERMRWLDHAAQFARQARIGLTVSEALAAVRAPSQGMIGGFHSQTNTTYGILR